MIIRHTIWNEIRDQFTEKEKAALNGAITGQAICPPGILIDEDRLERPLRVKICELAAPRKRQAATR
jgi:hypothetical protein